MLLLFQVRFGFWKLFEIKLEKFKENYFQEIKETLNHLDWFSIDSPLLIYLCPSNWFKVENLILVYLGCFLENIDIKLRSTCFI